MTTVVVMVNEEIHGVHCLLVLQQSITTTRRALNTNLHL